MNLARALLAASFLFLGCRKSELRVTLPAGYTGPVQVSCGSVRDAVTEVTVDASGNGQATFCPHVPASLVVLRGGVQIPVENDPSWSATGDGIPNGVRFTVK